MATDRDLRDQLRFCELLRRRLELDAPDRRRARFASWLGLPRSGYVLPEEVIAEERRIAKEIARISRNMQRRAARAVLKARKGTAQGG